MRLIRMRSLICLGEPQRIVIIQGRDPVERVGDRPQKTFVRVVVFRYRRKLVSRAIGVGLEAEPSPPGRLPTAAYNLLVTREWMLLVPRAREAYEDISVNALGFAGALLARDDKQLELLRAVRPMRVLKGVGVARR